MFIFLDESGDLGFNFHLKKPSEKFVVTLLACDDFPTRKKIVHAVKRTLKNKIKNKSINEIKGTRSSLAQKNTYITSYPERVGGFIQ